MQNSSLTRRSLGIAIGSSSASIVLKRSAKAAPRMAAAPPRLDAHVHVWAPPELADKFPYAGELLGAAGGKGAPPPLPGGYDELVAAMDAAGVAGALVVQAGNHLYDHSYLEAALAAYPTRLAGCLLADPRPGGGGVSELRRLAAQKGFRAVRFNPYLWPEGERMTNEVGRAMYAAAGELGLPVCFMPFKGLLRHIDEIEELARLYPSTASVIDHFGFAKCGGGSGAGVTSDGGFLASEEWRRLLALGRAHPQVYVKASAWFRVDAGGWPYSNAAVALRALMDAYGPRRVVFGTDWPWVTEQCGYQKAWDILDAAGAPVLTPEERRWVEGGALAALLPGAWGDGGSGGGGSDGGDSA